MLGIRMGCRSVACSSAAAGAEAPRFGAAAERRFSPTSASLGAVWRVAPGWQARESPTGLVLRSESGTRIMVQAYDRGGRDLDAVVRRLIRADRVLGANAALTEGVMSTTDGSLSGPPCVIVTVDETSGPCAFLADDDIVVSVQSLGSRAVPALPLSGLLDTISRSRP